MSEVMNVGVMNVGQSCMTPQEYVEITVSAWLCSYVGGGYKDHGGGALQCLFTDAETLWVPPVLFVVCICYFCIFISGYFYFFGFLCFWIFVLLNFCISSRPALQCIFTDAATLWAPPFLFCTV